MFVRPEYRGSGISSLIISELEVWAAEQGFHATILETGIQQPEAIRFYTKSGYGKIDSFGPYKGNSNVSIRGSTCCFDFSHGLPCVAKTQWPPAKILPV